MYELSLLYFCLQLSFQILPGNSDDTFPDSNQVDLRATYLRFTPKSFKGYLMCMRIEVFGCPSGSSLQFPLLTLTNMHLHRTFYTFYPYIFFILLQFLLFLVCLNPLSMIASELKTNDKDNNLLQPAFLFSTPFCPKVRCTRMLEIIGTRTNMSMITFKLVYWLEKMILSLIE